MEDDKRKRIAVDLDGTLTGVSGFPEVWTSTPDQLAKAYENLKPNKEIIGLVNKLYDKGYTIFIFTSRSNMYQSVSKKWLKKNKVRYHYLIVDKPYYDILIDDKCIHPEELKDKINEI